MFFFDESVYVNINTGISSSKVQTVKLYNHKSYLLISFLCKYFTEFDLSNERCY